MNERFEKLLAEAFFDEAADQDDTKTYKLNDAMVQKFAKLIVEECTEQVRGQYAPVLEDKEMMKDTRWDGYVQCGVDSVVAIREHFGVEQ